MPIVRVGIASVSVVSNLGMLKLDVLLADR